MSESDLHFVFSMVLQSEFANLEKLGIADESYRVLSYDNTEILSHKISQLPVHYLSIIFLFYCFEFSPDEITEMLKTDNVIGKLRYVRKILSCYMDLDEKIIAESSMKQACFIALKQYTSEYEADVEIKPYYSAAFRRKLKDISAAQSTSNLFKRIVKRIAIFILICVISFSTTLAVNAELREKFFNWVVEVFPQFSVFMLDDSDLADQQSDVDLNDFTVFYVPEDFELSDKTSMRSMIVYHYVDSRGRTLSITLTKETWLYKDTENTTINEIQFKNNIAFWWSKESITHFVWTQDDIECNITAELAIDEIIKIAENIKK